MEKKRKYTTTLLCAWFLGLLGIHRFYTGYKGIGIALLLCSTILPFLTCFISLIVSGVWVCVDFISICFNCYNDADGKPLEEYDPIIGKLAFTVVIILFAIGIMQNGLSIFDVIQTKYLGQ